MFSDCICVACPVSDKNLVDFVYILETFQLDMAVSGIFFRGGVAIGPHFETPRMIMSSALIEAYEIEHGVAQYPRIVFSENTIKRIKDATTRYDDSKSWMSGLGKTFQRHFTRDTDGTYFLNYFVDILAYDSSSIAEQIMYAYKKSIEEWIKNGITTGLTPSRKMKYEWLVNYHNTTLKKLFKTVISKEDLINPANIGLQ